VRGNYYYAGGKHERVKGQEGAHSSSLSVFCLRSLNLYPLISVGQTVWPGFIISSHLTLSPSLSRLSCLSSPSINLRLPCLSIPINFPTCISLSMCVYLSSRSNLSAPFADSKRRATDCKRKTGECICRYAGILPLLPLALSLSLPLSHAHAQSASTEQENEFAGNGEILLYLSVPLSLSPTPTRTVCKHRTRMHLRVMVKYCCPCISLSLSLSLSLSHTHPQSASAKQENAFAGTQEYYRSCLSLSLSPSLSRTRTRTVCLHETGECICG